MLSLVVEMGMELLAARQKVGRSNKPSRKKKRLKKTLVNMGGKKLINGGNNFLGCGGGLNEIVNSA